MKSKRTAGSILLMAVLLATMMVALTACPIFPKKQYEWSPKDKESLDGYWLSSTETGENGETYVRIWGLTAAGIKKSKTDKEATLPEYIKGYPVRLLQGRYWKKSPAVLNDFRGDDEGYESANLGELKRMKIEGCVTVKDFFSSKMDVVEFTNEKPSTIGLRYWIVWIAPDSWGGGVVYKKSEIIDGYIMRGNAFHGYIGTEKDLVIPEGVTGFEGSNYYIKCHIESIRLPKSMTNIPDNGLLRYIGNHPDRKSGYTHSVKMIWVYKGTKYGLLAFDDTVDVRIYE